MIRPIRGDLLVIPTHEGLVFADVLGRAIAGHDGVDCYTVEPVGVSNVRLPVWWTGRPATDAPAEVVETNYALRVLATIAAIASAWRDDVQSARTRAALASAAELVARLDARDRARRAVDVADDHGVDREWLYEQCEHARRRAKDPLAADRLVAVMNRLDDLDATSSPATLWQHGEARMGGAW